MDYATWRVKLHKLQISIDDLDEDYFSKEDFSEEPKAKYEADRKILCDQLDAMHRNHPPIPRSV